MVDTTLVVLGYKTRKYIGKVLNSIKNQKTRYNFEILVVVPKHDTKTLEVLQKIKHKIRFKIIHDPGIGAGCARNLGLKNAEGRIVIFMDGDIILKNNVVEDIVNILLENNGVGTVSPMTIGYGSKICSITMKLYNLLLKMLNYLKPMGHTLCLGCRKEEALKIGGFRNFWPGEDLDFVYRLNKFFGKVHKISQNSYILTDCRCYKRGFKWFLGNILHHIYFLLTSKPLKIKYKIIE